MDFNHQRLITRPVPVQVGASDFITVKTFLSCVGDITQINGV